MFVSLNQFYVFLACVTFGAIGGALFSIFAPIKWFLKSKIFDAILDVFCMIVLSVVFSVFSYKYNFPNLRAYMIFGALIGLTMYLKSFHRILAKFAKKFYNIIVQKFKKGMGKKNDRNKSKKANSSVNSGGSITAIYSSDNNGLSNNINSGQKKSHRIFRKSNSKIRNVNRAR